MKGRQTVLIGCALFVAWNLALVHAYQRKVVAVVVKDPQFKGAPVLKLDSHGIMTAPSNQAQVQQEQPQVAYAKNYSPLNTENFQVNDAPVPVVEEKPRKIIRYKLIRMSDKDIKRERAEKIQKKLHDAEEAKLKKALYPCDDYSPICTRYKNIWNPAVAQCRDVFMQRNCRETCGLCKIPVGVYLACTDMPHCKALATNSCVHKWVLATCKSMCGNCDGSKGRQNARVGASSVFVGKKKSLVSSKKNDEKKVKTINEAVKLQAKPMVAKNNQDDKKSKKEDDNNKKNEDDDDDDDNKDDDKEQKESSSEVAEEKAKPVEDKPAPQPKKVVVQVKKPVQHKDARTKHTHKTAAHKTAAHKTAAHKTADHKTAVHKTAVHKTAAHKTAAHKAHHKHHVKKTVAKVVHDKIAKILVLKHKTAKSS